MVGAEEFYFVYCIVVFCNFLLQYFFIFSERAARGGGGGERCQTFYFYLFFPVQQTTSGIGDRVKYSSFFGLATNALDVRNNINNNILTDRASTILRNIRGCQSGTWSVGQKKIRGTSTRLQREQNKQIT